MQSSAVKRSPYRILTLDLKVKVIEEALKGNMKKSEIASKYHIPSSTLSTFLKNKEKILQDYERISCYKKRLSGFRARKEKVSLVDKRTKRSSKGAEENYWDCSVCTYRNSAEAFKCLMCDVRKGTSTRKPRINPQLVAQQVAQQYTQTPPKPKVVQKSDKEKKTPDKSPKKIRPRLKNIDRSSAQQKAVTVNNVTVIITEFQPKRRLSSDNTTNGPHSSSGNSTDSSQSDSASHSEARNGDVQSERR